MQQVLAKLAAVEAKQDMILTIVTEQRDGLKEQGKRLNLVERKQSWFIGAWTVMGLMLAASVVFLKNALTP